MERGVRTVCNRFYFLIFLPLLCNNRFKTRRRWIWFPRRRDAARPVARVVKPRGIAWVANSTNGSDAKAVSPAAESADSGFPSYPPSFFMKLRHPLIAAAASMLAGFGGAMADEISVWSSTSVQWESGSAPVVQHAESAVGGAVNAISAPLSQSAQAPAQDYHAMETQAAPDHHSADQAQQPAAPTWAEWGAPPSTEEFQDYFHRIFSQMEADMRADMNQWPVQWMWSDPADRTASAPLRFASYLNGWQEVPSVETSGYGIAHAKLVGNELQYSVDVHGLTSAITGAHFHRAPRGQSGPVVHPFTFNGSHAEGTWHMSDQDVQDLLSGLLYVNVHTEQYPNGEVRGQL
jgi:hypothetical protein